MSLPLSLSLQTLSIAIFLIDLRPFHILASNSNLRGLMVIGMAFQRINQPAEKAIKHDSEGRWDSRGDLLYGFF